jgi:hypothetical protein
MPVTVKRLKSGKYRVSTPGGVKAKSTSMKKAKSQERILNMAEHGIPIPKSWSKKGK